VRIHRSLAAACLAVAAAALSASPGATAQTARIDPTFSLACLEHRTVVVNANSIGAVISDGSKTWGYCIIRDAGGASRSWWRRYGKNWVLLGSKAASAAAVPPGDAAALSRALVNKEPAAPPN